MYILMDYHTTCEVCGKRIDGVVARHVMNNDSSVLGSIGNNIADSVDATNAKKGLQNRVAAKEWKKLNFSNGKSGRCCPYCGARQSWENYPEPTEPVKPGSEESKKSNLEVTIFFGVLGGIVGMLVGLFVMIAAGTAGLIISAIVGFALGIAAGVWASKLTDKGDVETYPARMEAYKKALEEYREYQESLKTRTVKYEPEVDIESARVNDSDDATDEEWPGLSRLA
ncbi:MAG: hypothetical protein IJH41_01055 [Eubacterium sp.]|nr:hypothetical protein [Eubacterium sp.]